MEHSAMFTIALSLMLLFFMVIITLFMALKGIAHIQSRAKEKKSIKILKLGYEVVTVDNFGIPLLFKKNHKYVSLNTKGVLDDII